MLGSGMRPFVVGDVCGAAAKRGGCRWQIVAEAVRNKL
jgi:hypothetical protein